MSKRWIAAALALLLSCAAASAEVVENIASQCQYIVSEGSPANIIDDPMNSAWTPKGDNPELRIKLPDAGAAYIQIHWSIPPTDYTLTEYAADQSVVATHTQADDAFPCIAELLPLNAATRYVFLSFRQPGQGVNKVRVYPAGTLPATAVQWEPPHEKCDLMVISTHQDDEWLWFGGIIPYYDVVKDKKVQVLYMADCGRLRYAEALNALAVAGVRTYPVFLGLPDGLDGNMNDAVKRWKNTDYLVSLLVEQIRKFRPEVILTHDLMGEYGHPQHILTSRCMELAIETAADPNQYPESVQKYGAWQVKKLYRHLEKKDSIQFDWNVAYPKLGGKTPLQVASAAMEQNASQAAHWQVENHGEYDNSLFGLSYSAVGSDAAHADLFENVPDPTPEPTAAPAAPEATAEPQPEREEPARGSAAPAAIGIAAALAACGGIGFFALRGRGGAAKKRAKGKKGKRSAPASRGKHVQKSAPAARKAPGRKAAPAAKKRRAGE